MSGLIVVKAWRPEAAASPELRHLFEMCVGEARAIVPPGDVSVCSVVAGTPDELAAATLPVSDGRPWLLLGGDDVYVGRASLRAMLAESAAGAAAVASSRLDGVEPIRTLRDYERHEARLLEAGGPIPPEARRTAREADAVVSGADVHQAPVLLVAATAAPPAAQGERPLRADQFFEADLRPIVAPAGREVTIVGVHFELADYYGQVREDLVALVPAEAQSVLEIGCGRGLTGELLRARGAHVTGIDANPAVAADAATRLDEVIVGDVERLELEGRYDAIVAGELIEHLVDPIGLLRRLRGLLRSGGRIVLSTPNVGHHAVVGDLIVGRWDYVPAGPLCITHLRFATRRTLETWFAQAGYARWEIHPQETELPPDAGAVDALPGADRASLRTHGFLAVLHP